MILDTNAVSALLAGETALAEVLSGSERHELPVVVLGEYRYGLRRSKQRKRLEKLLATLARESRVLAIEDSTAAVYAVVRDRLREQGTPIPENDVWIASLAVEHNLPVVSRDAHFDHVDGLMRVSW
ncbi:MAG: PIN domain-containing protein [Planctomycetota bacterium]